LPFAFLASPGKAPKNSGLDDNVLAVKAVAATASALRFLRQEFAEESPDVLKEAWFFETAVLLKVLVHFFYIHGTLLCPLIGLDYFVD